MAPVPLRGHKIPNHFIPQVLLYLKGSQTWKHQKKQELWRNYWGIKRALLFPRVWSSCFVCARDTGLKLNPFRPRCAGRGRSRQETQLFQHIYLVQTSSTSWARFGEAGEDMVTQLLLKDVWSHCPGPPAPRGHSWCDTGLEPSSGGSKIPSGNSYPGAIPSLWETDL